MVSDYVNIGSSVLVSTWLSYGEHHKILYRFVDLAVLICHLVIAMGYTALWQITAIFWPNKKKKKKKKSSVFVGWAGTSAMSTIFPHSLK